MVLTTVSVLAGEESIENAGDEYECFSADVASHYGSREPHMVRTFLNSSQGGQERVGLLGK